MKRFLLSILLIGLLTVLGFGGWKYWQDRDAQQTKTNSNAQKTTDPTEGGKYLVIKEWGVRFPLQKSYASNLKIIPSDDIIDADNNTFQIANVYLSFEEKYDNCNTKDLMDGKATDTNIMFLRVANDSNFDTERYKGTIRKVLTSSSYTFYVNYSYPPCANKALSDVIDHLILDIDKLGDFSNDIY